MLLTLKMPLTLLYSTSKTHFLVLLIILVSDLKSTYFVVVLYKSKHLSHHSKESFIFQMAKASTHLYDPVGFILIENIPQIRAIKKVFLILDSTSEISPSNVKQKKIRRLKKCKSLPRILVDNPDDPLSIKRDEIPILKSASFKSQFTSTLKALDPIDNDMLSKTKRPSSMLSFDDMEENGDINGCITLCQQAYISPYSQERGVSLSAMVNLTKSGRLQSSIPQSISKTDTVLLVDETKEPKLPPLSTISSYNKRYEEENLSLLQSSSLNNRLSMNEVMTLPVIRPPRGNIFSVTKVSLSKDSQKNLISSIDQKLKRIC
jgi:hypothetical protein